MPPSLRVQMCGDWMQGLPTQNKRMESCHLLAVSCPESNLSKKISTSQLTAREDFSVTEYCRLVVFVFLHTAHLFLYFETNNNLYEIQL